MASERDNWIQIRVLLDVGKSATDISRELGLSKETVYDGKAREDEERKPGSSKKLNPKAIKEAVEAAPLKSLRMHAKSTLLDTVKNRGGKTLVRVERLLLTDIKQTHLHCCQALLSSLKSSRNRGIIFSDQKARYITLGMSMSLCVPWLPPNIRPVPCHWALLPPMALPRISSGSPPDSASRLTTTLMSHDHRVQHQRSQQFSHHRSPEVVLCHDGHVNKKKAKKSQYLKMEV